MPKVSVVIVNYNGRHLLRELLESLARQTRPADEVIVVDNASADESATYLRESFPWVKVIALDENTGFAEGNNIGVANAEGDYIALTNSDTVLDERWLQELVEAIEKDERVGAGVAKIFLDPSFTRICQAGAEFNNLGNLWGRGFNELDKDEFNTFAEVPALTACSMIVRRSALEGEPLFDRSLFMYYEEFDLTLRLRGHGHSIVYVPTAVVYHKLMQSVKKTSQKPHLFQQFYCNRNRIKILMKYYPPGVLLRNAPLIFLSLIYWDGRFLFESGPRLFFRSVVAQTQYALRGLLDRMRGDTVNSQTWLPWMKQQTFREIWALKSSLGAPVD
jgi:GT2 family glycosyltransferase